MDLPAFFSAKEPATFYLGSKSAELAGLADACILVEGTRLPVHSHVLSLHSRVLLGLFVERSAGAGSVRCGAEEASPLILARWCRHGRPSWSAGLPASAERLPRRALTSPLPAAAASTASTLCLPAPVPQAIMSDKGTLAAYGLPVVAHFLRLVYRPETATPGALCWHSDMLAACCRLAHLLDTPLLLSKLDACMQHEGGWQAGRTAVPPIGGLSRVRAPPSGSATPHPGPCIWPDQPYYACNVWMALPDGPLCSGQEGRAGPV